MKLFDFSSLLKSLANSMDSLRKTEIKYALVCIIKHAKSNPVTFDPTPFIRKQSKLLQVALNRNFVEL